MPELGVSKMQLKITQAVELQIVTETKSQYLPTSSLYDCQKPLKLDQTDEK